VICSHDKYPKTKCLDCWICDLIAEKDQEYYLTIKTIFLCITEERSGIVCQQSDLSQFVTLITQKTQYIVL